MSLATEDVPVVDIPAHARLGARQLRTDPATRARLRAVDTCDIGPHYDRDYWNYRDNYRDGGRYDGDDADDRFATVALLRRPHVSTPPLRLTRRGAFVLGAVLAVTVAALVGAAWLSAPRSAGPSAPAAVPSVVTVHAGDTLWAIAGRVAPQRDPRAEVDLLRQVNHLGNGGLVPGQVLHTK